MNELALLKAHDPAAGPLPPGDQLLEGLRQPSPRHRRRLAVLAVAGGLLTTGTGGLAYAVLSGHPPQSALQINCAATITEAEFIKGGLTSVMGISTGDPVADCRAEYGRLGRTAPELRAYTDGNTYLNVVPATWTVPTTWRPLPGTFRSDTARLTLSRRLSDEVDGPSAVGSCRSTAEMEIAVKRELAALGLTGWSIKPVPGSSPVAGECAFAFLDENSTTTVLLHSGHTTEVASGTEQMDALLSRLRKDIATQCLTLEEATIAVQRAARDVGLDVQITTTPSGARCTTVDLVPAGVIDIHLS